MDNICTEDKILSARELLDQLNRLPKEELSVERILTMGFMIGLDAAEATHATKLEAASK